MKRRSHNAMGALTLVLTPNLVNETRVAFSRVASFGDAGSECSQFRSGLADYFAARARPGIEFHHGTGFSPLGDEGNNPQDSVTNVYQLINNSSYVHGDHLIKFGIDFRFSQQNAFRDVESRGRLQFSPFLTLTNNALGGSVAWVSAVTSVARVDNPQKIRTESYNFFINDSFRVTPRLTLNRRVALRVQLAAGR